MNIPENSNTKRISIDLPEELISRFDQLRKEWGFRARGPVIEKILKELLQEDDLLPKNQQQEICLLYTSPSPRDGLLSRMPSSA